MNICVECKHHRNTWWGPFSETAPSSAWYYQRCVCPGLQRKAQVDPVSGAHLAAEGRMRYCRDRNPEGNCAHWQAKRSVEARPSVDAPPYGSGHREKRLDEAIYMVHAIWRYRFVGGAFDGCSLSGREGLPRRQWMHYEPSPYVLLDVDQREHTALYVLEKLLKGR